MADDTEERERRSLERRVYELEKQMGSINTIVAVTSVRVEGLVSTVESRHKAFERGQDLILDRLKPIATLVDQKLDLRLTNLEAVRNRAEGAILTIKLLGITGVVGGIVAIVQLIRGG